MCFDNCVCKNVQNNIVDQISLDNIKESMNFFILLIIIKFIKMMKNKNSKTKTALKFERLQIQKNEQNMSSDIITFRTHTLSKSEVFMLFINLG